MIPYLKTSSTLTVTLSDGTPVQISTEHNNFQEILDLVQNSDSTPANDEYLQELIRPVHALRKAIQVDEALFEITEYGELICKIEGYDYSLDTSLASNIVSLYKENGNIEPLLKFVVKLSRNPRKEVADELWGFISACGLTLTQEGNFLAYKNVNNDFTSVWDSKTDNSPGRVLGMPRQAVTHDPNQTCSAGLHFAAWGYLQYYASGRKTVLLSISPEDVVSIPTDYNNMKGRACRYKVLREVDQPEELKYISLYEEADELVDTHDYDSGWITWSKHDRKHNVTSNNFPTCSDLYLDTEVQVMLKNGRVDQGLVQYFVWSQSPSKQYRIVAYRIIE